MHLKANRPLATVLGALTGVVGLLAMFRLVSAAFDGPVSTFRWTLLLLAMLPWVAYATWRARHGHLTGRSVLAIAALNLVGVVVVWMFTVGPVLALVCSLAAFGVIWVNDWPKLRPRREERFVQFSELGADDEDDDEDDDTAEPAVPRGQPAA